MKKIDDVAQEAIQLRNRMLTVHTMLDIEPTEQVKQMLEEGHRPQAVRFALAMVKMDMKETL